MIIAIGETILDIIIKDNRPVAAVPGGSCFNSIISLGRTGAPCTFVGYSGNDRPGRQTKQMLTDNGVDISNFELRDDERSALSLAYLNHQGDADYTFYKTQPTLSPSWQPPTVSKNDIVLLGSYFAICDTTHDAILRLLQQARANGAIVYYDLNYRSSHQHELQHLLPAIHQNFQLATIVRGSADDFEVMYHSRDAQQIYQQHIRNHCPLFICTAGDGVVSVISPQGTFCVQPPAVDGVVSTVGAGDNFNAGLVFALTRQHLTHDQLIQLPPNDWQPIIETACAFAAEACRSENNYVSREFASQIVNS